MVYNHPSLLETYNSKIILPIRNSKNIFSQVFDETISDTWQSSNWYIPQIV